MGVCAANRTYVPQANTISRSVVDHIPRTNVIWKLSPTRLNRFLGHAIAIAVFAVATPAICSAASISLVGSWSYSQMGSSIVLTADRIQNNNTGGISGTVKMELWAFSSP